MYSRKCQYSIRRVQKTCIKYMPMYSRRGTRRTEKRRRRRRKIRRVRPSHRSNSRAIDLSCRACDACGAGTGCWAWIPVRGAFGFAPPNSDFEEKMQSPAAANHTRTAKSRNRKISKPQNLTGRTRSVVGSSVQTLKASGSPRPEGRAAQAAANALWRKRQH